MKKTTIAVLVGILFAALATLAKIERQPKPGPLYSANPVGVMAWLDHTPNGVPCGACHDDRGNLKPGAMAILARPRP